MRTSSRLTRFLLSATVALAAHGTVQAGTVHLSTGFERGAYTTGQLAGQDGWTGTSVATVQDTTAAGGQQALVVGNAGLAGQRLAYHEVSYSSVGNAEQIVRVSVDVMLGNLSSSFMWFDALALWGDDGFVSQTVVNGVNGQVCPVTPCNWQLSVNTWNELMMEIDFASGRVAHYVNGVLFNSELMNGASTMLTTVGLGINTSVAAANGTAYFDNLRVESFTQSVPEPGSLALAGLALAGMAGARRKAPCTPALA